MKRSNGNISIRCLVRQYGQTSSLGTAEETYDHKNARETLEFSTLSCNEILKPVSTPRTGIATANE
jgi:hypothetical protein